MEDRRTKILERVRRGDIGIEEALRLLDKAESDRRRRIRLKVTEAERVKWDITLPLMLARSALRFLPAEIAGELRDNGIDPEFLIDTVAGGPSGRALDVLSPNGLGIMLDIE
jgi:hypothetical protein